LNAIKALAAATVSARRTLLWMRFRKNVIFQKLLVFYIPHGQHRYIYNIIFLSRSLYIVNLLRSRRMRGERFGSLFISGGQCCCTVYNIIYEFGYVVYKHRRRSFDEIDYLDPNENIELNFNYISNERFTRACLSEEMR